MELPNNNWREESRNEKYMKGLAKKGVLLSAHGYDENQEAGGIMH